MSAYTPPKVSIKDVHKMPVAYVLMIMGALLGAVATWAINNSTGRVAKLNEVIDKYREEKFKAQRLCDSNVTYWQNKAFMYQDESLRYFKKLDSTNRAVLDQPARDLLKAINKK